MGKGDDDAAGVTLSSRLRPASDVLFRELENESVLVHLQGGSYFGLDPVGTRIWALLSECPDLAAVLEHLTQEFDVERARAEQDLLTLADTLVERGLVQAAAD